MSLAMLAPDVHPDSPRPPATAQPVAVRRDAVRRAFTLVELLVVIAILGVLIALMLPAVQAAREAARRQICSSHLREVGLAISHYESAVRKFPAGRIGCDDSGDNPATPLPFCPPGLPVEKKTAASGFITLLPYMEQQALHDKLAVAHGGLWNRNMDDLGWWYASHAKAEAIKERVTVYVCPSDPSKGLSDAYNPVIAATGTYAFIQGTKGPASPGFESKYENDGLFLYVIQRKRTEITDGSSQTIMLGETIMNDTFEGSNTWTYARRNADSLRTTELALNTPPGPGDYYGLQNGALGSVHPGGVMFAYADGHVDMIAESVELAVLRAASTIAGED
jgi:prepilin-type N-terminal cleavage/methylation domain-containing protein/prepilin-type processing-associated H-X9-DG protein